MADIEATTWEPGARLAGRVSPPMIKQRVAPRRDPRLVAAVILIAAIAIAVALWLAALWAQGRTDTDDEPEADEVALVAGWAGSDHA